MIHLDCTLVKVSCVQRGSMLGTSVAFSYRAGGVEGGEVCGEGRGAVRGGEGGGGLVEGYTPPLIKGQLQWK